MARRNVKNGRTERFEFRCSPEEKEGLIKLSEYLEIPASILIRNLVMTSYDDAILFKKLGILKGAKKLRDFKEGFAQILNNTNAIQQQAI